MDVRTTRVHASVWIVTTILACGANIALAQESQNDLDVRSSRKGSSEARDSRPFDGYGFISGYYDNNVFSYSDLDRQSFKEGSAPADKFPIENLADYVTTLSLRGDYLWNVQRHSMWRARILYDGNFYARNRERTWHRFGVSLKKSLRRSYVELSTSYTPDYYLRNLYWRPMPERPVGARYATAQFGKFLVVARGHKRVTQRVDGELSIGVARRNYDFPFDERDNNQYSIDGEVQIEAHPRLDISIHSGVDVSTAAGADSTSSAVEDVSNREWLAGVGAKWRLHRFLSFEQVFDYGHQVYTTDNIVDPAHSGRRDNAFTATSVLRGRNLSGWQPKVFFQYRSSSSTAPPGIAEFGQYTGRRFGLQVTYYL